MKKVYTMRKVCLLGSMKYYDKMLDLERMLILNDYCVFIPSGGFLSCGNLEEGIDTYDKHYSYYEIRSKLKNAFINKLKLSDMFIVCNYDNYIGDDTKEEIEYIRKYLIKGKDQCIYFTNQLPDILQNVGLQMFLHYDKPFYGYHIKELEKIK